MLMSDSDCNADGDHIIANLYGADRWQGHLIGQMVSNHYLNSQFTLLISGGVSFLDKSTNLLDMFIAI